MHIHHLIVILNKEKLLLFVLNVNLNIRVFVSSIKGNQMKKKVYIMLCDFYVKNYLIDRTKKISTGKLRLQSHCYFGNLKDLVWCFYFWGYL